MRALRRVYLGRCLLDGREDGIGRFARRRPAQIGFSSRPPLSSGGHEGLQSVRRLGRPRVRMRVLVRVVAGVGVW